MEKKFLPLFSMDHAGLLRKLKDIEGDYGILAPLSCPKNLLKDIRNTGKLFFIDSGVFENQAPPWYYQLHCEFLQQRWVRELRLTSEQQLRQRVKDYLSLCDMILAISALLWEVY